MTGIDLLWNQIVRQHVGDVRLVEGHWRDLGGGKGLFESIRCIRKLRPLFMKHEH